MLTKVMNCASCHQERVQVELVRNLTNSGTSQIFWRCPVCQRNAGGPAHFIEHKLVTGYGIKIEEIPIYKDNRTDRCCVCGTLGAELHHFAPRYLFHDDADKWPVGFLCPRCHLLWHNLVTPNMAQGGKHERL